MRLVTPEQGSGRNLAAPLIEESNVAKSGSDAQVDVAAKNWKSCWSSRATLLTRGQRRSRSASRHPTEAVVEGPKFLGAGKPKDH
jgi:hypothetical protein